MFGVCEMEKLKIRGLKRAGRATFLFCTTPFDFHTTCEMSSQGAKFSHPMRNDP